MIRLPVRTSRPEFFNGPEIQSLLGEVKSFYALPEKSRRQQKFEFPLLPAKLFSATLDALLTYTSGKCAYCETPVRHPGNATLERFRPKAGALSEDGSFSTEHYWWLAFEWENLYPACPTCNKVKGAKFPMDGARCASGSASKEVSNEPRLLLDPSVNYPPLHLLFLRNGAVHALSKIGEATIATLELNREDLVKSREAVAGKARALLGVSPVGKTIERLGVDWRPALHTLAVESGTHKRLVALDRLVRSAAPFSAAARAVVDEFVQHAAGAARSIPKAGSTAAHHSTLHSQIITRIEIRNFRGIANLDLAIDYSIGTGAPWTVVLGENGAGKSSILQAVALTLLSSDADVHFVEPRQVLRKGATSGYVRVWFHASPIPRELRFQRGQERFERDGPPYAGTLLAYGATRLLPRQGIDQTHGTVRVQNIFDPVFPLLDAARWLGGLDSRSFDFVARALRDVLGLPYKATLLRVRKTGEEGITLKQHGADLAFRELSDGYQSVLGLTCDIIAGLRALQPGALDASEAIVIVDELGAHLHPRWRMRIVDSLRKAFKRVQFIASTHDPLCLRGLENGEAVVLRRTPLGRVYNVPDLPPLKGLRVDQLLTSEFFGLDSTLDPVIESQFRELYDLLAKRVPGAEDAARIKELREALAPYEVPGATRRERRLLQVIDRELAQIDVTPDRADRDQIRAENDVIMEKLLKTPPSQESPV